MVLTFGEILLRLSPDTDWLKHSGMSAYLGGAELNVAMALAAWNMPVVYVSAMPENGFSKNINNYIEQAGVDISKMIYGGERLGLYYLPQGLDLKSAGMIYDRKYSSFSMLKVSDINWDLLFGGIRHFHMSAINPAINQNLADLSLEAVKQASKRDITISFDLNYRSKLWQYGKQPIAIIPEIVKHCDWVMGNIWAAEKMLGVPISLKEDNHVDFLRNSEESSKAIIAKFAKVKKVINTFRFDRPDGGIDYYGTLFLEDKLIASKEIKVDRVVDRAGSGDCFMAGIIYGIYEGFNPEKIVDFAATAATGKFSEFGDFTRQTVNEIFDRLYV